VEKGSENAAPIEDEDIFRFIMDQVDSVPHLEALLQLWSARPRDWSELEIAARLFVQPAQVRSIMNDLIRRRLVLEEQPGSGSYRYFSSPENDRLLAGVAESYRTNLIRISTAIHSKASSGVLEFAKAFQLTKKREQK
jgi:hypothetical protein